ncbi:MAG: HU family DNA-binding protein [Candidatus Delongbacteria bacterium]|nr:HU family DNA-binding protein [Candidatus Delongbacteria bacterium]
MESKVKKLTKFDIIKRVHEITGLSYKETGSVINNTIEVIKESLKEDFVIELRGFGTFKVAERAARIAYKPKGRERLEIPEKRVPVFKAVKSLKDKVNKTTKK